MAAGSPRMQPDERRKAILAIARDVFLTEGYAETSMSTIAARLGGSKGTLYNYFSSKETLFAEMVRWECQAEAAVAEALAPDDDDVATALGTLGRRLMRFIFSDQVQAIHRVVLAEAPRFPEVGKAFYENGPRLGIERLAGHMQRWMREGALKDADPVRASEQFGELCKAGLYQRLMWRVEVPTDAQIDANVEEAVAIFLAYYAA
jgi:AcrR family transcriptional regulator